MFTLLPPGHQVGSKRAHGYTKNLCFSRIILTNYIFFSFFRQGLFFNYFRDVEKWFNRASVVLYRSY